MLPGLRTASFRFAASIWLRKLGLALGFAGCAASLAGQNLLSVENDGKLEIVSRAEGNTAFVLIGEKFVSRVGHPLVLKPITEYLPVYITVLDPTFQRGNRAVSDRGVFEDEIVNGGRFVFNANLKASRTLDNVVLVFVLESKDIGNSLYMMGIGHLDAHVSKRVSIDEITNYKLFGVRLGAVHLFVGGKEVFNSTITDSKWESQLDRMISSRTTGVQDAELKALYVYDPIYPPELKGKIQGKAMVACEVDEHGKVLNASVTSTTNPAFGTAAIEAVRQWRFVPRVKDGHPIDAQAQVPIDFAPL
jgi:TonB family protein